MSDDKKRTRFSAVVEELTAPIKPTNKPTPGTKATATRELFTQVIKFVNGVPSSLCPRCGTSAFEPGFLNGEQKVMCRGCPLPSPIFDTETWGDSVLLSPTADGIKTKRYRCACRKESDVTIAIDQVNLYCRGCGRLAIHEMLDKPKSTGSITITKIRERQRVIDAQRGDVPFSADLWVDWALVNVR